MLPTHKREDEPSAGSRSSRLTAVALAGLLVAAGDRSAPRRRRALALACLLLAAGAATSVLALAGSRLGLGATSAPSVGIAAVALCTVVLGAAAAGRRAVESTAAVAVRHSPPLRRSASAAMLDAIRDGLVHCAASGRIIAVNDAMCTMTGFTESELVGAEPPLPYWADEDLHNMRAFIDGVIVAGHGEHELTLRRKNGERFAAIVTVGVDAADHSRVVLIKDVSDRAAMVRQIREATVAAETARAAFARSAEVIGEYLYSGELLPNEELVTDARGPGLGALLAIDEETAVLADYDDRVHHDDAPDYNDAWRYQTLLERDGALIQHEYRLVGYDGAFRWVRDRARVTVRDGRVFLSGAVCDISAQRHAEEQRAAMVGQLEHLSTVDPLTELFNRRHLGAVLRERLARPEARVAVAMADVDHFKAINDQHGHAVGDHVLKIVARRLRQATRPDDVVSRWGGEEFCVLLNDVDDDDALVALGERLRLAIEAEPISVGGATHLSVSVSVGAARVADTSSRPEELLASADGALYRAKAAGRNRTVIAQLEASPALPLDAAQTG